MVLHQNSGCYVTNLMTPKCRIWSALATADSPQLKTQWRLRKPLLSKQVQLLNTEADPDLLDLLDTSTESMGSRTVASIQLELASLAVSSQGVGATQMPGEQHQQQADEGGSEHLSMVRAVHGGATLNESHVRTDSDGEAL